MKPCRIALFSAILLFSCGGEPSSQPSSNPSSEPSSTPSSSSSMHSQSEASPSSSPLSSSSENAPSNDLIREALGGFNSKGFSTKGYEVSFEESYWAYVQNEGEGEYSSMVVEYSCLGRKKVSYEMEDESDPKLLYSPIEILSKGVGGFYLSQDERFRYVNSLSADSGEAIADETEVHQSHKLSVSFDKDSFMASTEEIYNVTSTGHTPKDYAHQYTGAIEMGLLLDSLSENLVDSSLSTLKFADATNYVDAVESHFMEMMPTLASLDEDSLNAFIDKYAISAQKEGESIKMSLSYAISDMLEDEVDGEIPAEIVFDGEGDIESFSYDFSNLIRSLDGENIEIDGETTKFLVEGKLTRKALDPIAVAAGDEYDDPIEFINAFEEYAFPRYFD